MKQLYTNKELEEIFKVSRSTLIRWREEGMPSKKIGGLIRFDIDEVNDWVESQNKKGGKINGNSQSD